MTERLDWLTLLAIACRACPWRCSASPLAWAGFDPQAVTVQGVTALTLAYGALPIGFKLVATALVWRFPLDRTRQAELQTAQPAAAG